ncbi:MAG: acyltransferase family protein [Gammaproteobacteria bacterium]|nr:acyltransferase family protein [Gammaproteobacteria bacterium]
MRSPQRIHYLDNLRALAMLLGVFFHAAVAYGPMLQNLWLSSGPEQSAAIDAVAWFTHLWRMPLFFMISGFFSILLIERRGMSGFLKNRGMRIAVPFIVFMPIIMALVFGSVGWAMQAVENPSPMLQIIIAMAQNPEAPQMPFSTMHLWFLFNLVLFCLALAAIVKAGIFNKPWLDMLLQPKWLLSIVPLLLVPALNSQVSPHPAAERIYPELWSFGFYGIFFFLGAVMYKRLDVLEKLQKYTLPLFIVSLVMYYFVYMNFPKGMTIMDAVQASVGMSFSFEHLIISLLEAYIAVYMTIVCLVLGKRYLSSNSGTMRYIADSSYWVYIIHLPVIFVVQFVLLDVTWGLWAEFWFSSLFTVAFGMLTYAIFVRWTPIGILLNGRRVPLRKRADEKRWDEVSTETN